MCLQYQFDAICISTTWLNDVDSVSKFMLDNYDLVFKNGKINVGEEL